MCTEESRFLAGFPTSPAPLLLLLSHPHLVAGPNFILVEASIRVPLLCAQDESLSVTSTSL